MDGRFRFGIMHVYPESVFPVVGLADGRFLPEGAVERRVYFPLRACAVRPDVVAAGEEGRAETGG